MRIAVLNWRDRNHPRAGGAEEVVHQQSDRLGKKHSVTLFTSRHTGQSSCSSIGRYNVVHSGSEPTVFFTGLKELKRENRREPFDVVLEHISGIPWISRPWVGRPVVAYMYHPVRLTFFAELPFPVSLGGFCLERLTHFFYETTPVLTLGKGIGSHFARIGFDPSRLNVVPPAVDEEVFQRRSGRSSNPTVLIPGPVKPYKRHDVALTIASKALVSHASSEVVITGWAREGMERELRRKASELGFSGSLRFTGMLDREGLADELSRAWCVLYASEREGWGLGVTEAAWCETPAVVPDVGGLIDTVVDGQTGHVYPSGDVEAAARKVAMLVGDQELVDRMGIAARRHAEEWTWDGHVGRLEAFLHSAREAGAEPG